MKSKYLLLILMLVAVGASADNSTLDAAIGGGIYLDEAIRVVENLLNKP